MKRIAVLPFAALALAACQDVAPTGLEAGVELQFAQVMQEVCHAMGNGEFGLITVADPALPSHIDHGDAQPGSAVPGMAGYIFDSACVPVIETQPEPPVGP